MEAEESVGWGAGSCESLGMRSERRGRPQQVFCCRDGDNTGVLILGEQNEKGRSASRYAILCGSGD